MDDIKSHFGTEEETAEADAPAETTEEAPETTEAAQPAEEKPADQPAA